LDLIYAEFGGDGVALAMASQSLDDPRVEDSGLPAAGGPGLQRGPVEVRGEGLALGGDHLGGDTQREPNLGVGALPVKSERDGVPQLTSLAEEHRPGGDPQVGECWGDRSLVNPRVGASRWGWVMVSGSPVMTRGPFR
jgi:hypothetical protein